MDKKQLNIFLSASIPTETRDERYFGTADTIAIRDSVLALAEVALPCYKLIWGGHPSITQLIANVLRHSGYNVQNSVTLYQSQYFEKFFPLENRSVAHIVKTKDKGNRKTSLDEMRERMIADNDFYAGIFIGGMEGVEEEFELFKSCHPKAVIIPVASTGAAAKMIYEKGRNQYDKRLETSMTYCSLFKDLLNIK